MCRSFATALLCTLVLFSTAFAQQEVVISAKGDAEADQGASPQGPPKFEAIDEDGMAYASFGSQLVATMPDRIDDVQSITVQRADGDAAPLALTQQGQVVRNEAGEVLSQTLPASQGQPQLSGDARTLTYSNVYPHTDDVYTIEADRLKHDWLLTQPPALNAEAATFGYLYTVQLPDGSTLYAGAPAKVEELFVRDAQGTKLYRFAEVVAIDAAGRIKQGFYRLLETDGAEARISLELCADWLVTASYPLRIDPTVISIPAGTTSSNAWPMNPPSPGQRYQVTYSPTQLQNTSGMIIAHGFEAGATFSRTYDRIVITIGETTRNSNNVDATFDNNFDMGTPVVVYDDTQISLSAANQGDFLMINFQTPFQYSGQNTLLVQYQVYQPVTGSTGFGCLQNSSGPNECFRIYSDFQTGSPTATSGIIQTTYFLGARFEIQSLFIDTTSLPDGTEGFAYSETLQGSGGTTPYDWSATGLPSGLTLDSATGEISGTPGASDVGSHTVDVSLTDANNTTVNDTFTLEIHPAVSLDPFTLPEGTETGVYAGFTPSTSGGMGPFTWSATGLPAGLSIDPGTGEISGTLGANSAGSYNVTVTVTDTNSDEDSITEELFVYAKPAITTSMLPRIIPTEEWGPHPIEHTGGAAPFTWTEEDLPEGLTLDSATGEVSGEVEVGVVGANYIFLATVTDAHNVADTREITLTTSVIGTGTRGCGCGTTPGADQAGALILLALLLMIMRLRRHAT